MEYTPNVTDLIYGGDPPGVGDPAEEYVEASKLHRDLSSLEVPGVYLLESSPWLVEATARAGRHLTHLPRLDLPSAQTLGHGPTDLLGLLHRRRSPETFRPGPAPSAAELGTWCWAACGVNGSLGGAHEGRTCPSGGAMFPCDLFVSLDQGPAGADGGTFVYDPHRHALFRTGRARPRDLAAVTAQPESFVNAAAVFVVVAALWRSRFKYGQRALRFALLEAGHLCQNLVLATQTTGHGTRPIGGFFDDEVATLLAVDGVHDVPLYMAVCGIPAAGAGDPVDTGQEPS